MHITSQHAVRWGRLLIVLALLAAAGAAVQPARGGELYLTYLPLVLRDVGAPGLWGYVTDEGEPAAGATLELYHEPAGYARVHVMSVVADAAGRFVFDGIPALPVGDAYVILYFNAVDNTRFQQLSTRRVYTYMPGEPVHVGNYDLANVALVSPGPGAAIAPPVWIEWVKRATSPDDGYMVILSELDGTSLVGMPASGWNDALYMGLRPEPMDPYTRYLWSVLTLLPGGGFGYSFEAREFCFYSCPALTNNDRQPDLFRLFPPARSQ